MLLNKSYFKIFLLSLFVFYSCTNQEQFDLDKENITSKSLAKTYQIDGYNFTYNQVSKQSESFNHIVELEDHFDLSNKNYSNIKLKTDEIFIADIENSQVDILIGEAVDTTLESEGFVTETKFIKLRVEDEFEYVNSINIIQRVMKKESVTIIETISPLSGDLLSYDLYNISTDSYLELRPKSFDHRQLVTTSDKYYCFTTYKACKQTLSTEPDSNWEAVCEWMPCSTISSIMCTFAYTNGDLEDSSTFNCAKCDVLIGEK